MSCITPTMQYNPCYSFKPLFNIFSIHFLHFFFTDCRSIWLLLHWCLVLPIHMEWFSEQQASSWRLCGDSKGTDNTYWSRRPREWCRMPQNVPHTRYNQLDSRYKLRGWSTRLFRINTWGHSNSQLDFIFLMVVALMMSLLHFQSETECPLCISSNTKS